MPVRLMERLDAALNAHDVDAMLVLMTEDYASEQPVHPDRAFGGREQVRQNWSAVFAGVPDFRSQLLRASQDGEKVWSEWHWEGIQSGGEPLEMAGVIIAGVRDERIAWARLYVEPVEREGAGIDAAVRRMTGNR
jgi:ketosteroid isomerase-like protein